MLLIRRARFLLDLYQTAICSIKLSKYKMSIVTIEHKLEQDPKMALLGNLKNYCARGL